MRSIRKPEGDRLHLVDESCVVAVDDHIHVALVRNIRLGVLSGLFVKLKLNTAKLITRGDPFPTTELFTGVKMTRTGG